MMLATRYSSVVKLQKAPQMLATPVGLNTTNLSREIVMPRKRNTPPFDLRKWLGERRIVARAYVDGINTRTVCAHCGKQPIEWHNPEHVELNRAGWRIGGMVSQGRTVQDIAAEMGRCTPLCRSCHMKEDGRLPALLRNRPYHLGDVQLPKSCVQCQRKAKPLRRGLCGRCYDRQRRRRVP